MQFHQVLVSAAPGDAITAAAFELRDLLRHVGPAEIYARYVHAELQNDVKPLHRFATRPTARPSRDVMIYHSAIGEPEVTRFVATRPERLIVMYHNISPWQRFLPFDPEFAGLHAAGRIELASLADKAILAMTVSEYNAAELVEAGFREIRVVPLVIDVAKLTSIEAHEPTLNHFVHGIDGPMVLFVGQMLPHKRPEMLLEAYHILSTYLIPEAALVMVGNHRLPAFSQHLEHQVNELNLNRAWITGSVDITRLVAFYRSASVFVTMSEHEGFCVPLIEAMGFDVPVIARGAAAVPETVGDAAVLLPDVDDAGLAAEAMAEVVSSDTLRATLVERGRERVTLNDPDVARAAMVTRVLEAANG